MTESSKPPYSGPSEGITSGVLFLKKPDGAENPVEWYSSKIAGVPFALRNLLTFQRVNIKDLAVFMEDPDEDWKKLFSSISKDSRISHEVVWISNIAQLKEWIQAKSNQVYIFNGSALHDKNYLNKLVNSPPKNDSKFQERLPINPGNLE